jgi:hypothetical protein
MLRGRADAETVDKSRVPVNVVRRPVPVSQISPIDATLTQLCGAAVRYHIAQFESDRSRPRSVTVWEIAWRFPTSTR